MRRTGFLVVLMMCWCATQAVAMGPWKDACGAEVPCRVCLGDGPWTGLRDNSANNLTVDIRQPEIAPSEPIGKLGVIEP